jgi:hypothetical protein
MWGIVCLLIHIGIDWGIARRDRKHGTDGPDGGPGTPAGGQAADGPALDPTGPASSEAPPRVVGLRGRRAVRRRA